MRKAILYPAAAIAAVALIASAFILPGHSGANQQGRVVITNFEQGHGFVKQSSSGNQTDDLQEYALGRQSMLLATQGDGSPIFTRKDLPGPANFTGRVLKVWVKPQDASFISELRISVSPDGFHSWADYWIAGMGADMGFLRNGTWNVITLSPAQATITGRPDLSRVSSIQVRVADTGRPAKVWLNSIELDPENSRGIVTFAFDDGYESDYLLARPSLDRYHFSATSYVAGSFVGSQGRMSLQELRMLQDLNGWDVSSHSFSHANMTQMAWPDMDADLALSKQFLEQNGLYRGSDHFAYPYGEFDSSDLRQEVQKYFKTARTISGPSETLPPSDSYRLRAMVVTNATSPEEVSGQVQLASSGGDWLILVFHRLVEENPQGETEYLSSEFDRIVDDVANRGVDVMTVSEVYAAGMR